jgi:uncharacterized protein
MKAHILIGISFMFVVQSSHAEPEIKGSPTELANYLSGVPRSVMVAGEGEVKSQADRAMVTVRVNTEHKSLADALQANEQIRGKLAAFLEKQGIGLERIRASRFSSTPKHGVLSDKVKLHRVENQIEITVHNEKEFQEVASVPDKFSEVNYVSVEFEHSEKEKLKTQAVTKACDDAERQRRLFEEKLGLKLTPRSFAQEFPQRPAPRFQAGTAPKYGSTTPLAGYGSAPETEVASESVSSFGELTFRVVVRVEYSSEPKQKP